MSTGNKRIHIFHPDGRVEVIDSAEKPTLEQLQGWVGGYIEHVECLHDKRVRSMYINEEGKLNGLPYNHKATQLFWDAHPQLVKAGWSDPIVGPAVVLEGFR